MPAFSVYRVFADIFVIVMSTAKLQDVSDASMRESCLLFSRTDWKCTDRSRRNRRKEILHSMCTLFFSWQWLTRSFIETWSNPSLTVLAGKSFSALILWRRSKRVLISWEMTMEIPPTWQPSWLPTVPGTLSGIQIQSLTGQTGNWWPVRRKWIWMNFSLLVRSMAHMAFG